MIGRSITTLRDQASTMGHEIAEQVELVTTFDSEVEQSQSRLKRAMGRMDELARRSDERCGGWCVWLLVVVSARAESRAEEAGVAHVRRACCYRHSSSSCSS